MLTNMKFTTAAPEDRTDFHFYIWGPVNELRPIFMHVLEYADAQGFVKIALGADRQANKAYGLNPEYVQQEANRIIDELYEHGIFYEDNTDELIEFLRERFVEPGRAEKVHWNLLPALVPCGMFSAAAEGRQ